MAKGKDNSKNISLKDYIDMRFAELNNFLKSKFFSLEQANSLAQDNLNIRLESMNEFRNQMKDQTSNFVTRKEIKLSLDKIEGDIRILRESYAEAKGKASQNSVLFAYVIAFTGIAIAVIGLISKL